MVAAFDRSPQLKREPQRCPGWQEYDMATPRPGNLAALVPLSVSYTSERGFAMEDGTSRATDSWIHPNISGPIHLLSARSRLWTVDIADSSRPKFVLREPDLGAQHNESGLP